jgi:hypothetical protein
MRQLILLKVRECQVSVIQVIHVWRSWRSRGRKWSHLCGYVTGCTAPSIFCGWTGRSECHEGLHKPLCTYFVSWYTLRGKPSFIRTPHDVQEVRGWGFPDGWILPFLTAVWHEGRTGQCPVTADVMTASEAASHCDTSCALLLITAGRSPPRWARRFPLLSSFRLTFWVTFFDGTAIKTLFLKAA